MNIESVNIGYYKAAQIDFPRKIGHITTNGSNLVVTFKSSKNIFVLNRPRGYEMLKLKDVPQWCIVSPSGSWILVCDQGLSLKCADFQFLGDKPAKRLQMYLCMPSTPVELKRMWVRTHLQNLQVQFSVNGGRVIAWAWKQFHSVDAMTGLLVAFIRQFISRRQDASLYKVQKE
jgi:hypothetical protein